MIAHFIEFEGGPARANGERGRVTLNSRGVFLLNRHIYEAIDRPAAVTLHFDPNRQVIGLKPADPSRRNAFPLRQKDKFHNRTINASSFCKHFKITLDRTVLFNDVDITPRRHNDPRHDQNDRHR